MTHPLTDQERVGIRQLLETYPSARAKELWQGPRSLKLFGLLRYMLEDL